MADTTPTPEAPKGEATPNRGTLQSYLQNFTREAIDSIVEILRTTNNEALRMGAAKLIIDKSIPDMKAVELTGENGEPIKLNIISGADYVSTIGNTLTASTGSVVLGSTQTKSTGMAPASSQNNDSNQPDSQVESA